VTTVRDGRSGVQILVEARDFYPSRTAPGPTQPPVQWVAGVKLQGREIKPLTSIQRRSED
jgi:hypothetical protein